MLTFITNLINGKLNKYNKGILSVELNQAIDNIDEDDKTGDQIDEKDILKGIVVIYSVLPVLSAPIKLKKSYLMFIM